MRKGDRTSLAGKIGFSRHSNGDTPRGIHIEIEDAKSGLVIAELEMSPEGFGNAVTGLGYQDCVLTYVPTEDSLRCYGKKREVKTLTLDVPHYPMPTAVGLRRALVEQFPDWDSGGWEILRDGLRSQQNGKGWEIVLMRFVEEKA